MLAHHASDAGVIEIECVPGAAAEVGFSLDKNGLVGALFHGFNWFFQEIAGVEQNGDQRQLKVSVDDN